MYLYGILNNINDINITETFEKTEISFPAYSYLIRSAFNWFDNMQFFVDVDALKMSYKISLKLL